MAPPRFAVRSVAIIGAGSSGLTAARYIEGQGAFDRIVVYEQRAEVGGLWTYSRRPTDRDYIPQESPYLAPDPPLPPDPSDPGDRGAPVFPSPTYDRLFVNIPHPLMGFTDLPIASVHEDPTIAASLPPLTIFPQRQTIAAYLTSYSQAVRHLIRFSTKVDDVRLLRRRRPPRAASRHPNGVTWQHDDDGDGDMDGDEDDYVDQWEVHATHLLAGTKTVETFDAVIVAQGHYDITFVPDIANIRAFDAAHPGVLTHAKRYRNAAPYRDKKVLIVGNSASGLDIAPQVNEVCQRPLYLSVRTPSIPQLFARIEGAEERPEIAEFLVAERGVRFTDGRVLRDLDAVLFCTGYLFALPFLKQQPPRPSMATATTNTTTTTTPKGGGLAAPMLSTGRRIHRLYDDLFHIDHPTLAFLCLPMKVVPYAVAQCQAAVVARTWANTLSLPSRAAMDAWEQAAEAVRGPTFHEWPHGQDGVYINATYERIMAGPDAPASRAGKAPPRWDAELLWMRSEFLKAKAAFEATGQTATSLAELGLVYDKDGEATAAVAAANNQAVRLLGDAVNEHAGSKL
ncbi:flavin dependent oxidoreductase [Niveomyces insectorum RCEF 264]|uniref:Flavin dependent oxidoreductase n=1 Tax=Niveomyces insectorum RCEF 264 TaxID=1081102 RepID=A0A167Z3I2_9HYPO|nr:flavin dependent oxidoreductase [Niveomyces insectorum RCEF 264]